MKRFFALLALLLAPLSTFGAAPTITNIAMFPSVSVAYTNYVSELITTNGVTIGGVRNTTWPAGGIVGTVSNAVASAGLLSVDSTKTNGIAATSAHVITALGYAPMPDPVQLSLTHAGTVTLTFANPYAEAELSLTGSVTFATSNLASTNKYVLYGRNSQATNCTPTFPSWRWMGGAPSTITALKEFTLSLSSRGTVDTNVWAAYSEAQ